MRQFSIQQPIPNPTRLLGLFIVIVKGMMQMLNKLLIAALVFFISSNVSSAPVAANCKTSFEHIEKRESGQTLCGRSDAQSTLPNNQSAIAADLEKEVPNHVRLSNRQPSIIESIMAMFFIPGLILLWFSRFTKSSK